MKVANFLICKCFHNNNDSQPLEHEQWIRGVTTCWSKCMTSHKGCLSTRNQRKMFCGAPLMHVISLMVYEEWQAQESELRWVKNVMHSNSISLYSRTANTCHSIRMVDTSLVLWSLLTCIDSRQDLQVLRWHATNWWFLAIIYCARTCSLCSLRSCAAFHFSKYIFTCTMQNNIQSIPCVILL